MKKLIQIGVLPLLALILVSCADSGLDFEKDTEKLEAFTLDDTYECTTILDDDLETAILYSTKPCHVTKHGLLGIEWHDIFIRALKHKKTGVTIYGIRIVNFAKNWEVPYQMNYKFGEDLISSEGVEVHTDVQCANGECVHQEIVDFIVSEDYLADLSARYDEVKGTLITFRVKKKKAMSADWQLSAPEIVGLYRKVKGIK